MAQFKRALAEIRLEQTCISVFHAVPTAPLREELTCYKIDDVPTSYDSFSKRFIRVLTRRIMMLVEPWRIAGVFQSPKNGYDETVAILRTMGEKHMMGTTWQALDSPIPDHPGAR
jgi:hypothetical protein